jgi:hypothetical protein
MAYNSKKYRKKELQISAGVIGKNTDVRFTVG